MGDEEWPCDVEVVVVGAGFAGLYAVHHLRNVLGMSVRCFEAESDIGGTWQTNRYPGARCDSESWIYCYSFSRELLSEWDWGERYPVREQILAYLHHVAARFDLLRSITFDSRVTSLDYDDDTASWMVTTASGESVRARYVVMGVGFLASAPYVPEIPGLRTFEGRVVHTGQWPPTGFDVAGRRVGMIGTGSSSAQAIPVLAQTAAHLYVFQRTPHYVIPAHHGSISASQMETIKGDYGAIWDEAKWSDGGYPWSNLGRPATEDSDDERDAQLEELWRYGGMRFVFGNYNDILTNFETNEEIADFVRQKVRELIDDPNLAEQLVPPKGYPIGATRPIVADGYYEAFARDNVTLVDLRSEGPLEVGPHGVSSEHSSYDLDDLVLATGFDAMTGPYLQMEITGRDGAKMEDHWSSGPRTYMGFASSGFPNFFMIVGPGSTFGNYPVAMEHAVEWIGGCLREAARRNAASIEVTREAEEKWMDRITKTAGVTVVGSRDSWWNGGNIPGKPRSVMFYFGRFGTFRRRCAESATNGYPELVMAGQRQSSPVG